MDLQFTTLVAGPAQAGRTILAALRQWLPNESWSAVRRRLTGRRVLLNDVLCVDEARRLKAGDRVLLSDVSHPRFPSAADVRCVWLDSDLVVVDKPAGMVTLRHFSERGWSAEKKARQPTLDDVLPALIAAEERRLNSRAKPPGRIDSVHRIDRDTSGLLVFSRTATARQHLIGQFKRHTVERCYRAIVHGNVEARTIESFLVEDRGDGRRGSTARQGQGKRAVTHLRPLERLGKFTLVDCRLETGRTHQIRIHLSEAGHPLLGDVKYGMGTGDSIESGPFPRIALHAATLGFIHPANGQALQFESPVPADLVALLERLRERERK